MTEPKAPRTRSLAAEPTNTTPATGSTNSSGRVSAIASIDIAPMLCPTSSTGLAPTAASTAARSWPNASGDRSPPAALALRPCERKSNRTHR